MNPVGYNLNIIQAFRQDYIDKCITKGEMCLSLIPLLILINIKNINKQKPNVL